MERKLFCSAVIAELLLGMCSASILAEEEEVIVMEDNTSIAEAEMIEPEGELIGDKQKIDNFDNQDKNSMNEIVLEVVEVAMSEQSVVPDSPQGEAISEEKEPSAPPQNAVIPEGHDSNMQPQDEVILEEQDSNAPPQDEIITEDNNTDEVHQDEIVTLDTISPETYTEKKIANISVEISEDPFFYQTITDYIWDAKTHTYKEYKHGAWTNNNQKIKIKNCGDQSIEINLEFISEEETQIKGSILTASGETEVKSCLLEPMEEQQYILQLSGKNPAEKLFDQCMVGKIVMTEITIGGQDEGRL